ncbi:MAG: amylosucrase [Thermomicrobiales bacterium]|nr:amylosucrase [Thermomicrobiales bacterium]
MRSGASGHVLVLANVAEHTQTVAANELRLYGLAYDFVDLVTDQPVSAADDLVLAPYRFVWLVPC